MSKLTKYLNLNHPETLLSLVLTVFSLHFGLLSYQKCWKDTWWMGLLWSQPPDTKPPTISSQIPLFYYVLSLNSHFSGVDLRKGALWPSTPRLPLHTARPLSSQGPGDPEGNMSVPPTRDATNKSTFHFYMRHLKPSLHEKQSSHLRGGRAPAPAPLHPPQG